MLFRKVTYWFAFISGVMLNYPAAFGQTELMGWRSDDTHSALSLIEVREVGTTTVFALKNSSTKAITAFSVSHDGITHTIDFFQTGSELSSGSNYALPITTEELRGSSRILQIVALIFADGGEQGSHQEVLFVSAKRLGRVLETERVKALLATDGDQELTDSVVEALTAKVGTVPQTFEEAFPSVSAVRVPGFDLRSIRTDDKPILRGLLLGIRSAREDALWKIEQLKRLPVRASDARRPARGRFFSDLKSLYSTFSAKNMELLQSSPGGNLR